ncbi:MULTISPECIES: BlaI/MecI/CopY family transcriptional regulator [unclassified Stenotrophomonas]|uniref:BlaI/MecI/CopY family transcriptional regulator n=1 Tax=unclassified Stenotrophomonas TaxID=196198 RepID=UPI0025EE1EAB|nr:MULTISPECIES: BlaI/MecI/CopY family transcriptional regulator [unclassified Stenotrophomonas]
MIRISEAEAVVMEVLWSAHPLSADEVMARLPGGNEWAEATVKTLLNRLLNKAAITATKEGRRFLYTPLVQRDAWLLEESSSLIERLFDGRVAPLVAHFSQHQRLSRDDVAELRKLLEELDDDQH